MCLIILRMLSFKPLKDNASRHIASIEDNEGKIAELLYFTELSRDEEETTQASGFAGELTKYTLPGSSPTDFHMKRDYKLSIIPSNNIKGLQRETVSIFGKSGSGKSWQIKNYIRNYHLLKPKNDIFFLSLNKLADDESFDEDLCDIIQQVNLRSINKALSPKDFENSLFIFDDILDVNMSLDPEDVFGEQYQRAGFKDQVKMEKDCEAKTSAIKIFLNKTVQNILNQGRKYNVSCLAVYHKMKSGPSSVFLVEESSSCWLYPYGASKRTIASFLEERLSLSKDDTASLAKEKFYQYDFLSVNNSGKIYYFTPNHFKFL